MQRECQYQWRTDSPRLGRARLRYECDGDDRAEFQQSLDRNCRRGSPLPDNIANSLKKGTGKTQLDRGFKYRRVHEDSFGGYLPHRESTDQLSHYQRATLKMGETPWEGHVNVDGSFGGGAFGEPVSEIGFGTTRPARVLRRLKRTDSKTALRSHRGSFNSDGDRDGVTPAGHTPGTARGSTRQYRQAR